MTKINKKQIPLDIGSLVKNYQTTEEVSDNLHIAVTNSATPTTESLSLLKATLIDMDDLGGGSVPDNITDTDAAALVTSTLQVAFTPAPGEEVKTMSFAAHAALLDNYWGLSAALDAINGE